MHALQLLVCSVAFALATAKDDPAAPVSFKSEVAPILVRNCLGCHNDRKAEHKLNISTFAKLRSGGEDLGEGIIEPGKPEESHLIEVLGPSASPRMPYKQPPLSDGQIDTITRWVKEGAKFDGPSETDTLISSLVDPLRDLPKIAVSAPTSDAVTAVAFAPDGKALAAAVGRSVLLFDLSKPESAATLGEHAGPVLSLLFTPDGKTLIASGGRPGMFGSIAIWDLESRKKLRDVRPHDDAILSSALAPGGKTLATSSYDKLIKLWDVAAGTELRTLKEHTDAVFAVAFSPDGKTLASASADRTVKVWDAATGRKRVTLGDSTAELYAVAFGSDGQTVLAAGVDRSIRAWRLAGDSGTLERSIFAHDAPVLRLFATPDGKALVSCGEDRTVKVWDLAALKPLATFGGQSDWPMALAISADGARIAIGRYDGSLTLAGINDGATQLTLRSAPMAKPAESEPAPKLVENPSLGAPSARGGARGSKVKLTLNGTLVGEANAVIVPEAGIEARIVPREKPDPNALDVELTIAENARVGVHRIGVRTALGVPGLQAFAVSAAPEASETEPNEDAVKVALVALPATLVGAIDKAGDVDFFRFEARAGQTFVFETLARPLGSSLNAALALFDGAGGVVAKSADLGGGRDAVLVASIAKDGVYALRVADADFGSGNHFYRISAGQTPYIDTVFPLGVSAGGSGSIRLRGVNPAETTVEVLAEATHKEPGALLSVSLADRADPTQRKRRSIVVGEGPQAEESGDNDQPANATAIANPGGVSARIERAGDVDHFKFEAREGQPVVVEVFGRRLESPIDSVIEILDSTGAPVPRAVLRRVEETFVAFRDHPSTGRNIRLTQWANFNEGDYVLMGRELMRINELPRNPDDDAVFWGLGNPRNNTGDRIAFLGTTPEHHPQGQAISKVEIHPPGSKFPPGGAAPITLFHRNDDGGPAYGKDSHLIFNPPATGVYIVRVEDVRGLGGDGFGYHLLARPPRPDFRLSVSAENPNVARGGAAVVTVTATRMDDYDGPIDITAENLPPGISASAGRIEPDLYSADLVISADGSAAAFSSPTWTLRGRAPAGAAGAAGGEAIEHVLDPGGSRSGFVTVTPPPDLKIAFAPEKISIHPGERIEVRFKVDREKPFEGRVPLEVRNLPWGVRVLNIGLNGVLVTENEAERTVFLIAEPWAPPTERTVCASGRLELLGEAKDGNGRPVVGSSREYSSPPIPLVVAPRRPIAEAASAR